MREVYYVEIKVEDEKNIELVKNTVLMFCSYDYAMFDELAVEDSAENLEKRYKTNTLTDTEKNKLEELCEENDRIQTKIAQNTITLYLDINDIVGGEANYWFGNFVALAEILPNINFEMKLERRNETIDAFSCGNGAYKNGVLWYYGTEFFPECTVRLNGIEYDCSQCRSPEDYPQFFEAGKFIDGKYVSLENVNITNVKGVAICFTEPKFYAEKEFFTKIMAQNGGFVRKDVSGKTNYLIYNPECGYETSNLRYAKELNEEGKNIKIVTVEEFIETLQIVTKK